LVASFSPCEESSTVQESILDGSKDALAVSIGFFLLLVDLRIPRAGLGFGLALDC
jgi:hypothetical protein